MPVKPFRISQDQLQEIQSWDPATLTPEQKRKRRQVIRLARGTKLRSKATRKGVNKRKKR